MGEGGGELSPFSASIFPLSPRNAWYSGYVCWRPFVKIFVSATEFCRCNKSQKKKIVRLVAATKFCCSHKDFHKRSPVHTKRFVAAKSRRHMLLQLLSRSVYRPLGFYRNIFSLMMVFHLSGTAKNRNQDCQRFNLWKLTKWSYRWTVRRKTQRCDDLYRGRG